MSFNSLDAASKDQSLQDRTIACVQEQARENAELVDTAYAALVRANPAEGIQMIWPVALNTEAQYESALAAGVPDPGGDESVISDGMILSAVQTSWIADGA